MSEDKFYPSADEWMWSYCIFLGKFVDSKGNKWDLGVHIESSDIFDFYRLSAAIVHGNESGDYYSGDINENVFDKRYDNFFPGEAYRETYRRAKEKGLFKRKED
jgi:hypothetical protein